MRMLTTSCAIADQSCEVRFASLLCNHELLLRDEAAKVCKSCVSGLLLTDSCRKRTGVRLRRDVVPSWLCVMRQFALHGHHWRQSKGCVDTRGWRRFEPSGGQHLARLKSPFTAQTTRPFPEMSTTQVLEHLHLTGIQDPSLTLTTWPFLGSGQLV